MDVIDEFKTNMVEVYKDMWKDALYPAYFAIVLGSIGFICFAVSNFLNTSYIPMWAKWAGASIAAFVVMLELALIIHRRRFVEKYGTAPWRVCLGILELEGRYNVVHINHHSSIIRDKIVIETIYFKDIPTFEKANKLFVKSLLRFARQGFKTYKYDKLMHDDGGVNVVYVKAS